MSENPVPVEAVIEQNNNGEILIAGSSRNPSTPEDRGARTKDANEFIGSFAASAEKTWVMRYLDSLSDEQVTQWKNDPKSLRLNDAWKNLSSEYATTHPDAADQTRLNRFRSEVVQFIQDRIGFSPLTETAISSAGSQVKDEEDKSVVEEGKQSDSEAAVRMIETNLAEAVNPTAATESSPQDLLVASREWIRLALSNGQISQETYDALSQRIADTEKQLAETPTTTEGDETTTDIPPAVDSVDDPEADSSNERLDAVREGLRLALLNHFVESADNGLMPGVLSDLLVENDTYNSLTSHWEPYILDVLNAQAVTDEGLADSALGILSGLVDELHTYSQSKLDGLADGSLPTPANQDEAERTLNRFTEGAEFTLDKLDHTDLLAVTELLRNAWNEYHANGADDVDEPEEEPAVDADPDLDPTIEVDGGRENGFTPEWVASYKLLTATDPESAASVDAFDSNVAQKLNEQLAAEIALLAEEDAEEAIEEGLDVFEGYHPDDKISLKEDITQILTALVTDIPDDAGLDKSKFTNPDDDKGEVGKSVNQFIQDAADMIERAVVDAAKAEAAKDDGEALTQSELAQKAIADFEAEFDPAYINEQLNSLDPENLAVFLATRDAVRDPLMDALRSKKNLKRHLDNEEDLAIFQEDVQALREALEANKILAKKPEAGVENTDDADVPPPADDPLVAESKGIFTKLFDKMPWRKKNAEVEGQVNGSKLSEAKKRWIYRAIAAVAGGVSSYALGRVGLGWTVRAGGGALLTGMGILTYLQAEAIDRRVLAREEGSEKRAAAWEKVGNGLWFITSNADLAASFTAGATIEALGEFAVSTVHQLSTPHEAQPAPADQGADTSTNAEPASENGKDASALPPRDPKDTGPAAPPVVDSTANTPPHLTMPSHHTVQSGDFLERIVRDHNAETFGQSVHGGIMETNGHQAVTVVANEMDVLMDPNNAHWTQTDAKMTHFNQLHDLYVKQGGFVTHQDVMDNGLLDAYNDVQSGLQPGMNIEIPAVNLDRVPAAGTFAAGLPVAPVEQLPGTSK